LFACSNFHQSTFIAGKPLPVNFKHTSSDQLSDRDQARHLGVADYLVKRASVNEIAQLLRDVARRWLTPAPQP
jgi:CheY-like chemotaxis protein